MWWLVCAVASHTDGMRCLKGNWIIPENLCEYIFDGKKTHFTIDDGRRDNLVLDINPSRYSHKNLFNIWLDTETMNFTIATNRNAVIGNGAIAFDRRCSIKVVSMLTNNISVSIDTEGGMGLARFARSGEKICSLSIEKVIKYDSWKFALTILLGVISMFIGIGGFLGFSRNDLFELKSVPIDNPDEGYTIQKDDDIEPVEHIDEFDSDDGY